jgi:hypothetical protein
MFVTMAVSWSLAGARAAVGFWVMLKQNRQSRLRYG